MNSYKYDAFISYRRQGGDKYASLLKFALADLGISRERIFLDVHNLRNAEDFEENIKAAVRQSANVIVVVSKGCFDERRVHDLMADEISTALAEGINIVPVFFDDISSFQGMYLPDRIKAISHANGIRYVHEYSEAVYKRILSYLVNVDIRQGTASFVDMNGMKHNFLSGNNRLKSIFTAISCHKRVVWVFAIVFSVMLLWTLLPRSCSSRGQVFVTPQGSAYHRESCSRINVNNAREMSIEEAKELGKRPCQICHPGD